MSASAHACAQHEVSGIALEHEHAAHRDGRLALLGQLCLYLREHGVGIEDEAMDGWFQHRQRLCEHTFASSMSRVPDYQERPS